MPLPDSGSSENATSNFALFAAKMDSAHLPRECIKTFEYYYKMLIHHESGLIPEKSIVPVQPDSILDLGAIKQCCDSGIPLLAHTAVIKLNGGLGTTMGCQGPKSLIPVKDDLSFLDIIIKNLLKCNKKYQTAIPLILMNSFNTEAESLEVINQYPEIKTSIPSSFLQHKFPRISAATFEPVTIHDNPSMEWNPPGHGDLYLALQTSGTLKRLIDGGFKYAFISNSDNVNAYPDPAFPGYMEENRLDFLMEVAERTPSDQKGGHVARTNDNLYTLREIKQCPDVDIHYFKDIGRHQFFNTNNLWINLHALETLLNKNSGELHLPLICNQKVIQQPDGTSASVYQLESAMGSIISYFSTSSIIHVPRTRFLPVKNTNDLLLMKSDVFTLTNDYVLTSGPGKTDQLPLVNLDPVFFGEVAQLSERFPFAPPSLVQCKSFTVKGNVRFGKDIVLCGDVSITNNSTQQVNIPDAANLSGSYLY